MSDEQYYWIEVYPYKDGGDTFMFEINREDKGRREEYYSTAEDAQYEMYSFDGDRRIRRNFLKEIDLLNIVRHEYGGFWQRNLKSEPNQFDIDRSNRKKHITYVLDDYRSVLRALEKVLSVKGFYYQSGGDLVQFGRGTPLAQSVDDPYRHYMDVYMFRTEYDEGYSGCLITIENAPKKICHQINLGTPIFGWLSDRLEGIPCVVEFEFPNVGYHFGNTTLDLFVKPFLLELSRTGRRSVLFAVDDSVMYIKTNPLISDQERFQQLDKHSGTWIDPKRRDAMIHNARKVLGKYWDKLSDKSASAFPEGLEHYRVNLLYENNILDASPASVQFAKCVEIEIEQRILMPFRDYFNQRYRDMSLDEDMADSTVFRMTKFLVNREVKAPEMGTFSFFLSVVINSKRRANKSPTIKAFKGFIETFENGGLLLSSEFQETLNRITTKYRNGAAHTSIMPFAETTEFYELLIGRNRDGFLFKLLDSLTP